MRDILDHALRLGLYPGFAWIGFLVASILWVQGRRVADLRGLGQAWRTATTPLAWLGALGCGGFALTLLPWSVPNTSDTAPNLWLLWISVEGCHLLSLLPGLSSSTPLISRAAAREAQLSTVGRMLLWLGVLVVFGSAAQGLMLARLVGLIAVAVALPLALYVPPFGEQRGTPWAEAIGSKRALVVLLAALRQTILLALVSTLVVRVPGLAWWLATGAQWAIMLGLAAIARGLIGSVVQQRLSQALRWAWRIALPLGIVALILLALGV